MEESGNQTTICCVLFLDIVEYSKKSVSGQISLKNRLNSYLSTAICDVPLADRIILDTDSGVAINFIGAVEDALKTALGLRESLLNEDPNADPPLLVRMGINLGPVRLVRDSNGQPNIVGDGINVAQRIMSFADAGQILVSRSYYDAVSRLSAQYVEMLHYQGSRTDKQVREHEIYAIGYPGDKTMQRIADQQAGPKRRILYVGIATIFFLLLVVLVVKLVHRHEILVVPDGIADKQSANTAQPVSAVAPAVPAETKPEDKAKDSNKSQVSNASRQTIQKDIENKKVKETSSHREDRSKTHDAASQYAVKVPSGNSQGYVAISCIEGTGVLIDGVQKGRVGSWPLTMAITAGRHTVALSSSGAKVYSQDVVIEMGKTVHIEPSACN